MAYHIISGERCIFQNENYEHSKTIKKKTSIREGEILKSSLNWYTIHIIDENKSRAPSVPLPVNAVSATNNNFLSSIFVESKEKNVILKLQTLDQKTNFEVVNLKP